MTGMNSAQFLICLRIDWSHIAASELAFVEPDFDTRSAKGITDLCGRRRILGCIAEKHSVRRLSHERNHRRRSPEVVRESRSMHLTGTSARADWVPASVGRQR